MINRCLRLGSISLSLASLLFCYCLTGCQKKEAVSQTSKEEAEKKWDTKSPDFEYALIQSELKLSQLKKPYFVIDLEHKKLILKLSGVVVWDVPMQIETENSDSPDDFSNRFISDNPVLVRPLFDKHLFAGKEKSSDSVLKIVSEVVRAKVDLMQREVPERFQLEWENGLVMEFRTEIAGLPRSKFKNTMVELRRTLQRPFGESYMIIRMDSERAITLYRVAERGLPTIVYPPK